jgi:hypothetical protein|tara:strand:+ start:214 stop:603 length:390 start_codon:yes stop_codon:yes gene_type:complete
MTATAEAPVTILHDDLMDLPPNSPLFLVQFDGPFPRSYGRILSTYADGSGFGRNRSTQALFRFVPITGEVHGDMVQVHVFFAEDIGDEAGTLVFIRKAKLRASVSVKLKGHAAKAHAAGNTHEARWATA